MEIVFFLNYIIESLIMSYKSINLKLSRTPCTLCKMTVDVCSLTFGVSPCTATGTECYNTFKTCKDKINYDRTIKELKFTSADAQLPFIGPLPYILSVDYLPTEIKTSLTVKGRVKITLADEPCQDNLLDPYKSSRGVLAGGTFWKRFLARFDNWKNRPFVISEGFVGIPESQFEQRWAGVIDNITLAGGKITVEVIDLLEDLSKISLPPKLSGVELLSSVAIGATTAVLSDATKLPSAGYVRIGDEIIQYSGISLQANQLTGMTRGIAGTTPASYSSGEKVEIVLKVEGNPFDIMYNMLTNSKDIKFDSIPGAGISTENVDSVAWAKWKTYPTTDTTFSAWLIKPTKLSDLFFEIVSLIDCSVWQNEDQKITIRRNIPNEPGRSYLSINDAENLVINASSVNLNETERKSRVSIYWDKKILADDDEKTSSYSALEIAIDADEEGENGRNEIAEDVVYCRWLRNGVVQDEIMQRYIQNLVRRRLYNRREQRPIITVSVEQKDDSLLTGKYLRLTTGELTDITGADSTESYSVQKRDVGRGKIRLTLIRQKKSRILFFSPSSHPDYMAATDDEREYGYIADTNGVMSNGDPGYHFY